MLWQWLLYEQKRSTTTLVLVPLFAACCLVLLLSMLQNTDVDVGHAAGAYLGWFSALCYNLSRVIQLHHTCSRGTTEGVALALFLSAFLGEVFQAASYVGNVEMLPWLVSSLFASILDVISLSLFYLYRPATDGGVGGLSVKNENV